MWIGSFSSCAFWITDRSEAIMAELDGKSCIMISEHQLLGKW